MKGTEFSQILPQIKHIVNSGAARSEILDDICTLLNNKVDHYDWVGFYILDEPNSTLVLESYFGKPTEHMVIPVGKGVCGQVAVNKKLKIVQDVTQEGNYIACSVDVQSEIVVPILKGEKFMAEIDIDSHAFAPFTTDDQEFLTSVCRMISILF
jgi:L-methionine (R)-S-oxide reductase